MVTDKNYANVALIASGWPAFIGHPNAISYIAIMIG